MKKRLVVGLALAATMVTACSGHDDRNEDPSTAATTAAAADVESGGASDVGGVPLVLDEQTTTWFAGFCTGFAEVRDSLPSVVSGLTGAAGNTPQERQAAAATVLAELGRTFEALAADTGALPPPTIANGGQMATAAVDGFAGIGAAMVEAADRFARAPVTDAASLQEAATRLQTTLREEGAKAEAALSAIDTQSEPGLDEAVGALPECAELTS